MGFVEEIGDCSILVVFFLFCVIYFLYWCYSLWQLLYYPMCYNLTNWDSQCCCCSVLICSVLKLYRDVEARTKEGRNTENVRQSPFSSSSFLSSIVIQNSDCGTNWYILVILLLYCLRFSCKVVVSDFLPITPLRSRKSLFYVTLLLSLLFLWCPFCCFAIV